MTATRFDQWLTDAEEAWKAVTDVTALQFRPNLRLEHTGGNCLALQLRWGGGLFLVTDGEDGEPSGPAPSGNRFCVGWYPGDATEAEAIPGCPVVDHNGLYWTREASAQELTDLLDELTDHLPFDS